MSTIHEAIKREKERSDDLLNIIKNIMEALGTDEIGEALIEVARNAHRAEQELASLKQKLIEEI